MASKDSSQKNRVADPNKTKNGRTRLGPLNFKQLTDMLAKSSRPKERAKIQRRIQTLVQRGQVPKPVVVVEETTAE